MGTYKQNRSRKPLELETCRLRMTDAIKKIEKIILTAEDQQKQIQAAHALSGLINRYAKLTEITEMEERLSKLEQEMKKTQSHALY